MVTGIVEVGEVLNLGDGQQAHVAGALGDAEDRLLVEQCVENAAGPEAASEPGGDVIDAALPGHILAEQNALGILGHQIEQSLIELHGHVTGWEILG